MANGDTIAVNVVVAALDEQRIIELVLPAGACVHEALGAAQLAQVSADNIGVFGRRCGLTRVLEDGDQVEIYRALLDDPKNIRRRRAQARR